MKKTKKGKFKKVEPTSVTTSLSNNHAAVAQYLLKTFIYANLQKDNTDIANIATVKRHSRKIQPKGFCCHFLSSNV